MLLYRGRVRVVAIIPTLNARTLLESALASLGKQTMRPHVIVVDNGSSDGTAEMVAHRFPEVELVRSEQNLGFGRAIMLGAERADADILVLVNNDVVCEPQFVAAICAPFAAADVGMVAGVLTQARAPSRIDTAGIELDSTLGSWDYLADEPVGRLSEHVSAPVGPCGGAAAYRLSAFRGVGGFDPNLFAYWEDVDLALAMRRAGWRCVLARDARAEHRHGATLGAASPRQRELHAFGRGFVLAKYRVARRHPVRRAMIALLDWPALLVHLVIRRETAPMRARRRGHQAGSAVAIGGAPPMALATIGFPEALRRQFGFLRRRLSGSLPAHLYEKAPEAVSRESSTRS